jgi:hypothetical protein
MSVVVDTLKGVLDKLLAKEKAQNKYFELKGKSSNDIEPVDILGGRAKKERGYVEEYYPRPKIEEKIIKRIEANDNLLIIGPPLSGKTRVLYEALKKLKKSRNVLTLKLIDIDLNDFSVPIPITFFKDRILVIDDLDKYVSKPNFVYVLNNIYSRNLKNGSFLIAATCRSGPELEIVKGNDDLRFFDTFGDPIKIPKLDDQEGEKIAKEYGLEFTKDFDGNIGTLFMSLDEMKERFIRLDETEKGILRALKRLYYAGISEGREVFSLRRVVRVCKEIRKIDLTPDQWETHLRAITENAFIERGQETIRGEEAYFYNVIEDYFSNLVNLRDMLSIFSDDPEALSGLANIALNYWFVNIVEAEAKDIRDIGFKAYTAALVVWTLEEYPDKYAITQRNLGDAYGAFARREDTAENHKKAIEAYSEALKVFTLDQFPREYAIIKRNIGGLHLNYAHVEEPLESARWTIEEAIMAFEDAVEGFKRAGLQEEAEIAEMLARQFI